MTNLIFDGNDFCEFFLVEKVSYDLPSLDIDTQDVPGMDGVAFTGATTSMPPLTVRLTSKPGTVSHRRALKRKLAEWLDVDEPKRLFTVEDDGRYRYAVPSGSPSITEGTDTFSAEVSFEFPDPYLYGETRRIPLTEVSNTFRVRGTVPTLPTIAVSATPSGGYIGLRLDDGDVMQVPATAASSVVADCMDRVVTANGTVAMITLDSDWFELSPGTHTIAREIGTFTTDESLNYIEFTERWR